MDSFDHIFRRYNWQPIEGCPGRWVLRTDGPPADISCLLGVDVSPVCHRLEHVLDEVLVYPFEENDGGIISYRRSNGSICHTLGDASGFVRKLKQLQIE